MGVTCSIVFGHILDKTRAYKKSMFAGSILPLLTCIGFRNFLPTGNFLIIAACGAMFCSSAYFMTPLCMAFSAEVTYPLKPPMVNGTLQIILQCMSATIAFSGTLYLSVDLRGGVLT